MVWRVERWSSDFYKNWQTDHEIWKNVGTTLGETGAGCIKG